MDILAAETISKIQEAHHLQWQINPQNDTNIEDVGIFMKFNEIILSTTGQLKFLSSQNLVHFSTDLLWPLATTPYFTPWSVTYDVQWCQNHKDKLSEEPGTVSFPPKVGLIPIVRDRKLIVTIVRVSQSKLDREFHIWLNSNHDGAKREGSKQFQVEA